MIICFIYLKKMFFSAKAISEFFHLFIQNLMSCTVQEKNYTFVMTIYCDSVEI